MKKTYGAAGRLAIVDDGGGQLLGMSEQQFQRYRGQYEEDGNWQLVQDMYEFSCSERHSHRRPANYVYLDPPR